MTDEAGFEGGLKKSQVSRRDQVDAKQRVASAFDSSGPEILAKERDLEISLFGISRKLLVLDALVRTCVEEIVAISKLPNSPLPEIGSEILDEYNAFRPAQLPVQPLRAPEGLAPSPLSKREREVVRNLAEGKCNKEIASVLGLSVKTVETYRARIMIKLNAHSLNDIFRFALRHKILEV